ncbi:MAG: hypothetical protein ABIG64_07740 [Candidatus Omnitrophota bacterium]
MLRRPKSSEPELNKSLQYIQEVTRGKGLADHLIRIKEKVMGKETDVKDKGLGLDEDAWKKLEIKERLKQLYELREIWQILNLIMTERSATREDIKDYERYEKESYTLMQEIMSHIQSRVIFDEDWPETFLRDHAEKEDERDYERAFKELDNNWGGFSTTSDLYTDDILCKIKVNADDHDYSSKQIATLKDIADKHNKAWKGKHPHQVINEVSYIFELSAIFKVINAAHNDKEKFKKFYDYIGKIVDNSPIPSHSVSFEETKKVLEKITNILGIKEIRTDKHIEDVAEKAFLMPENKNLIIEQIKTNPEILFYAYHSVASIGIYYHDKKIKEKAIKITAKIFELAEEIFGSYLAVTGEKKTEVLKIPDKVIEVTPVSRINKDKIEITEPVEMFAGWKQVTGAEIHRETLSDGSTVSLYLIEKKTHIGIIYNFYHINKYGEGKFLFDEEKGINFKRYRMFDGGHSLIQIILSLGTKEFYHINPEGELRHVATISGIQDGAKFDDWIMNSTGFGILKLKYYDKFKVFHIHPEGKSKNKYIFPSQVPNPDLITSKISANGYALLEDKENIYFIDPEGNVIDTFQKAEVNNIASFYVSELGFAIIQVQASNPNFYYMDKDKNKRYVFKNDDRIDILFDDNIKRFNNGTFIVEVVRNISSGIREKYFVDKNGQPEYIGEAAQIDVIYANEELNTAILRVFDPASTKMNIFYINNGEGKFLFNKPVDIPDFPVNEDYAIIYFKDPDTALRVNFYYMNFKDPGKNRIMVDENVYSSIVTPNVAVFANGTRVIDIRYNAGEFENCFLDKNGEIIPLINVDSASVLDVVFEKKTAGTDGRYEEMVIKIKDDSKIKLFYINKQGTGRGVFNNGIPGEFKKIIHDENGYTLMEIEEDGKRNIYKIDRDGKGILIEKGIDFEIIDAGINNHGHGYFLGKNIDGTIYYLRSFGLDIKTGYYNFWLGGSGIKNIKVNKLLDNGCIILEIKGEKEGIIDFIQGEAIRYLRVDHKNEKYQDFYSIDNETGLLLVQNKNKKTNIYLTAQLKKSLGKNVNLLEKEIIIENADEIISHGFNQDKSAFNIVYRQGAVYYTRQVRFKSFSDRYKTDLTLSDGIKSSKGVLTKIPEYPGSLRRVAGFSCDIKGMVHDPYRNYEYYVAGGSDNLIAIIEKTKMGSVSNVKQIGVKVNDCFVLKDHLLLATDKGIRMIKKSDYKLDTNYFYGTGIYRETVEFFSVYESDGYLYFVDENGGSFSVDISQLATMNTIFLNGNITKQKRSVFKEKEEIFNSGNNISIVDLDSLLTVAYNSKDLSIGEIADFAENKQGLIFVIGENANKIIVLKRTEENFDISDPAKITKRLARVFEISFENYPDMEKLLAIDIQDDDIALAYKSKDKGENVFCELTYDSGDKDEYVIKNLANGDELIGNALSRVSIDNKDKKGIFPVYASEPLGIGKIIDMDENSKTKIIYTVGEESNNIIALKRTEELGFPTDSSDNYKKLKVVDTIPFKRENFKKIIGLNIDKGKLVVYGLDKNNEKQYSLEIPLSKKARKAKETADNNIQLKIPAQGDEKQVQKQKSLDTLKNIFKDIFTASSDADTKKSQIKQLIAGNQAEYYLGKNAKSVYVDPEDNSIALATGHESTVVLLEGYSLKSIPAIVEAETANIKTPSGKSVTIVEHEYIINDVAKFCNHIVMATHKGVLIGSKADNKFYRIPGLEENIVSISVNFDQGNEWFEIFALTEDGDIYKCVCKINNNTVEFLEGWLDLDKKYDAEPIIKKLIYRNSQLIAAQGNQLVLLNHASKKIKDNFDETNDLGIGNIIDVCEQNGVYYVLGSDLKIREVRIEPESQAQAKAAGRKHSKYIFVQGATFSLDPKIKTPISIDIRGTDLIILEVIGDDQVSILWEVPLGVINKEFQPEEQSLKKQTVIDQQILALVNNLISSKGESDVEEIITILKSKLNKEQLKLILGSLSDEQVRKIAQDLLGLDIEGKVVINEKLFNHRYLFLYNDFQYGPYTSVYKNDIEINDMVSDFIEGINIDLMNFQKYLVKGNWNYKRLARLLFQAKTKVLDKKKLVEELKKIFDERMEEYAKGERSVLNAAIFINIIAILEQMDLLDCLDEFKDKNSKEDILQIAAANLFASCDRSVSHAQIRVGQHIAMCTDFMKLMHKINQKQRLMDEFRDEHGSDIIEHMVIKLNNSAIDSIYYVELATQMILTLKQIGIEKNVIDTYLNKLNFNPIVSSRSSIIPLLKIAGKNYDDFLAQRVVLALNHTATELRLKGLAEIISALFYADELDKIYLPIKHFKKKELKDIDESILEYLIKEIEAVKNSPVCNDTLYNLLMLIDIFGQIEEPIAVKSQKVSDLFVFIYARLMKDIKKSNQADQYKFYFKLLDILAKNNKLNTICSNLKISSLLDKYAEKDEDLDLFKFVRDSLDKRTSTLLAISPKNSGLDFLYIQMAKTLYALSYGLSTDRVKGINREIIAEKIIALLNEFGQDQETAIAQNILNEFLKFFNQKQVPAQAINTQINNLTDIQIKQLSEKILELISGRKITIPSVPTNISEPKETKLTSELEVTMRKQGLFFGEANVPITQDEWDKVVKANPNSKHLFSFLNQTFLKYKSGKKHESCMDLLNKIKGICSMDSKDKNESKKITEIMTIINLIIRMGYAQELILPANGPVINIVFNSLNDMKNIEPPIMLQVLLTLSILIKNVNKANLTSVTEETFYKLLVNQQEKCIKAVQEYLSKTVSSDNFELMLNYLEVMSKIGLIDKINKSIIQTQLVNIAEIEETYKFLLCAKLIRTLINCGLDEEIDRLRMKMQDSSIWNLDDMVKNFALHGIFDGTLITDVSSPAGLKRYIEGCRITLEISANTKLFTKGQAKKILKNLYKLKDKYEVCGRGIYAVIIDATIKLAGLVDATIKHEKTKTKKTYNFYYLQDLLGLFSEAEHDEDNVYNVELFCKVIKSLSYLGTEYQVYKEFNLKKAWEWVVNNCPEDKKADMAMLIINTAFENGLLKLLLNLKEDKNNRNIIAFMFVNAKEQGDEKINQAISVLYNIFYNGKMENEKPDIEAQSAKLKDLEIPMMFVPYYEKLTQYIRDNNIDGLRQELKILLTQLMQSLQSQIEINEDYVERKMPEALIKALLSLAMIKAKDAHDPIFKILAKYEYLLNLFINQNAGVKNAIEFIEQFQKHIDFGQKGLIGFIAGIDTEREQISGMPVFSDTENPIIKEIDNLLVEREQLSAEREKLQKSLQLAHSKAGEVDLEALEIKAWSRLIDGFFRYYCKNLSDGIVNYVVNNFISNDQFVEAFIAEYGLEKPAKIWHQSGEQAKIQTEFTYELLKQSWLYLLFPEKMQIFNQIEMSNFGFTKTIGWLLVKQIIFYDNPRDQKLKEKMQEFADTISFNPDFDNKKSAWLKQAICKIMSEPINSEKIHLFDNRSEYEKRIKMIIEALEGKRDLNKVLELIEVAEIFESIGTKKYPPLIELDCRKNADLESSIVYIRRLHAAARYEKIRVRKDADAIGLLEKLMEYVEKNISYGRYIEKDEQILQDKLAELKQKKEKFGNKTKLEKDEENQKGLEKIKKVVESIKFKGNQIMVYLGADGFGCSYSFDPYENNISIKKGATEIDALEYILNEVAWDYFKPEHKQKLEKMLSAQYAEHQAELEKVKEVIESIGTPGGHGLNVVFGDEDDYSFSISGPGTYSALITIKKGSTGIEALKYIAKNIHWNYFTTRDKQKLRKLIRDLIKESVQKNTGFADIKQFIESLESAQIKVQARDSFHIFHVGDEITLDVIEDKHPIDILNYFLIHVATKGYCSEDDIRRIKDKLEQLRGQKSASVVTNEDIKEFIESLSDEIKVSVYNNVHRNRKVKIIIIKNPGGEKKLIISVSANANPEDIIEAIFNDQEHNLLDKFSPENQKKLQDKLESLKTGEKRVDLNPIKQRIREIDQRMDEIDQRLAELRACLNKNPPQNLVLIETIEKIKKEKQELATVLENLIKARDKDLIKIKKLVEGIYEQGKIYVQLNQDPPIAPNVPKINRLEITTGSNYQCILEVSEGVTAIELIEFIEKLIASGKLAWFSQECMQALSLMHVNLEDKEKQKDKKLVEIKKLVESAHDKGKITISLNKAPDNGKRIQDYEDMNNGVVQHELRVSKGVSELELLKHLDMKIAVAWGWFNDKCIQEIQEMLKKSNKKSLIKIINQIESFPGHRGKVQIYQPAPDCAVKKITFRYVDDMWYMQLPEDCLFEDLIKAILKKADSDWDWFNDDCKIMLKNKLAGSKTGQKQNNIDQIRKKIKSMDLQIKALTEQNSLKLDNLKSAELPEKIEAELLVTQAI